MDLKSGYDFDKLEDRKKCWSEIEKNEPTLVIGSPPCTPFSTWQRINNLRKPPEVVDRELRAGIVHIEFCCRLYRQQMQRGAYFLHEQPDQAGSWDLPCIRELMCKTGVQRATCDQCQYGQEDGAGNPVKKPTGWLGNAPEVMAQLRQRCGGRGGACSRKQGGIHRACSGLVARRAAIYQAKLCTAILRGMQRQLLRDGYLARQNGNANLMVSRVDEHGINLVMHDGDDEILACDRELAD